MVMIKGSTVWRPATARLLVESGTPRHSRGVVFQRPGAQGNADSIRIMEPTPQYPQGYVRYYNSFGQPLDVNGKPTDRASTHIPLDYNGPINRMAKMSNTSVLSTQADFWLISFEPDQKVIRCCVDVAFSLDLSTGHSIRIENSFVLHNGTKEYELSSSNVIELGNALVLYGEEIKRIVVFKTGELELSFSNGFKITVMPNNSYEAWEIAGITGVIFVCLPGGEIASWLK